LVGKSGQKLTLIGSEDVDPNKAARFLGDPEDAIYRRRFKSGIDTHHNDGRREVMRSAETDGLNCPLKRAVVPPELRMFDGITVVKGDINFIERRKHFFRVCPLRQGGCQIAICG
jgi:hypothetical protein